MGLVLWRVGQYLGSTDEIDNIVPVGMNRWACYNPDADETDQVAIIDSTGHILSLHTPQECMKLGEFAEERQARYS